MDNKTGIDLGIGITAASSPLWLQYIQSGAALVTAIGGAVLVIMRLIVVIRDWKKKGGDTDA